MWLSSNFEIRSPKSPPTQPVCKDYNQLFYSPRSDAVSLATKKRESGQHADKSGEATIRKN